MRNLPCHGLFVFAMLLLVVTAVPAQTYTKLRDLGTQSGDPLNPASLGIFAQGRDANLYSTTQGGGDNAFGSVFQLTPSGTMTRLYSFSNPTDGSFPNSGLTLGTDGSLYGTTSVGGPVGFGNVFKITTGGNFTVLHNFNGNTEGLAAVAPPIQGPDGNFYGTTGNGNNAVFGTVYKMTPSGTLTILFTFNGTIRYPQAIALGTDGNFYGTFLGGTGVSVSGGVFRITPAGAFKVLHNFNDTDGKFPKGAIIQASDGNFYGTTRAGGTDGLGVVYKMTPAGVLTVIHNFLQADGLGSTPFSGLVQATDGKFYGTTIGPARGLLYQITTAGVYTVMHTFGGADGQSPQVSPFQQTGGTLYGDTDSGGIGNIGCIAATCGVLYSLDMGLGPFVSIVNWSGKVGKTIEILGQGFTGTTKVTFNGTTASFSVASDTYLTTVVPAGATSGFIRVFTPGGTLTSNRKFLVVPSLLSFNPTSGQVGTPVVITGTSFTGAKKVTFAGVSATFTVDSDTQISTTVPSGAVTGKIQVTTPGGKATSATNFTVLP